MKILSRYLIVEKVKALLLLIFSLSIAACSEDTDYKLTNDASSVYFATIKKEYVVEPAYFKKVNGSLDKTGNLVIDIDLNSVTTGIPIRDQRLGQLFFITATHPLVSIKTKLNMLEIKEIKGSKRKNIDVDITLNGQTKKVSIDTIIRYLDGKVLASTAKPIIIKADDYGIPAKNLMALAKTVGGIPISTIVPVSFDVILE